MPLTIRLAAAVAIVATVCASSLFGSTAGQHLVRPAARPAMEANTTAATAMPSFGSAHCATVGELDTSVVYATGVRGFDMPFSAAVVTVTFTPDASSSTVPSTARCGRSTATGAPALRCGSTHALALKCTAPPSNTENVLSAAGASVTERLIAVSQDTVVADDDTTAAMTVVVKRRLQRGLRCGFGLIAPADGDSAEVRICGRVTFTVAGFWDDRSFDTAGVAPFAKRSQLAASTTTDPASDNAGWATGVASSADAAPLARYVSDVSALEYDPVAFRAACDTVGGTDGCALVHTPATHPTVYDSFGDAQAGEGRRLIVAAADTPAADIVTASRVCSSGDGGVLPVGGGLIPVHLDHSATRQRLFMTLSDMVSSLDYLLAAENGTTTPLMVQDITTPGSFAVAYIDLSQSSTDFVVNAPSNASTVRAVCTLPMAAVEASASASAPLVQVAHRRDPCHWRDQRSRCDESSAPSGSDFCRFSLALDGINGECCWNGIFLGPNATAAAIGVGRTCSQCRSTGVVATPPSVWDTRCRVSGSRLYVRNLVGLSCSGASDAATCTSDSYRCGAADIDGLISVNNALAFGCASSVAGRRCMDPSLTCVPATANLPSPPPATVPGGGAAQTPAPASTVLIPTSVNITYLDGVVVRDGTIYVGVGIGSLHRNTFWHPNITGADFEALIRVLTPQPTIGDLEPRFALEVRTGPLITSATVTADGRTVVLGFGELETIAPEWEQDFEIASSADLWEYETIPSATPNVFVNETRPFAPIRFTIGDRPPSKTRADWAFYIAIAASVAGLASGFTGWIGLAAMQPGIVATTMNCAPPRIKATFQDASFLVTPAELLPVDSEGVFGVQIGFIAGVGILHLCVVLFHYFFISSVSFRASSLRVRFPSSVLYAFGVLLTGTVRVSYNLVFFHRKFWMRAIVFTISSAVALVIVGIWVQVLRRGSESYYLQYDLSGIPRPLKPFFPHGWWPETRSFTPVRALTKAKASVFSLAFLVATLIMAGNAGYEGQSITICSATYTNNAIFHGVLLAVFLIMRPFRIPALNAMWLVARSIDFALNLFMLGWVVSRRPFVNYSDNVAWLALSGLLAQLVFNLLVFAALTLERGFRVKRKVQERREERERQKKEEELDDELDTAKEAFEKALRMRQDGFTGALSLDGGGHATLAEGAAADGASPRSANATGSPRSKQRRRSSVSGGGYLSSAAHEYSRLRRASSGNNLSQQSRGLSQDSDMAIHHAADANRPPAALGLPLRERPDDELDGSVYRQSRFKAGARAGNEYSDNGSLSPFRARHIDDGSPRRWHGSNSGAMRASPLPINAPRASPLSRLKDLVNKRRGAADDAADGVSPSPSRRGVMTPAPKPPPPLTTPSVVEVAPMPPDLSEGELMHMMLPFAPSDVHHVGRSAFVSVANRTNALSMVAAFDGRMLLSTRVTCSIVGDDL